MRYRLILCLILAGCSAYPVVPWPTGPVPPTPPLLLKSALVDEPPSMAEARGAALAAQATALTARAAAIGTH